MRTVSPFAACWNKRGGKTDFYPASGFRASESGGLLYVGSAGFFWSGSPDTASSVTGADVDFNKYNVYPENRCHRAFGYPVRCVQE